MRLIEVDTFKEFIKEFIEKVYRPLCDDYHMKDYVLNQLLHDIENEPTVEAIPVAWLTRKYCAAGVFASPSYHKRADIVRQIIRDYKREQEQIGETEC